MLKIGKFEICRNNTERRFFKTRVPYLTLVWFGPIFILCTRKKRW